VIPALASIAYGLTLANPETHYILLQLPIALQAAGLV
jgi:hypothetical protein